MITPAFGLGDMVVINAPGYPRDGLAGIVTYTHRDACFVLIIGEHASTMVMTMHLIPAHFDGRRQGPA